MREREVEARERECDRHEGILAAQQERMFSAIKLKREKLHESSVLSAQTQSAVQERESQLKGLSAEATSQATQHAALHADLQEVLCLFLLSVVTRTQTQHEVVVLTMSQSVLVVALWFRAGRKFSVSCLTLWCSIRMCFV